MPIGIYVCKETFMPRHYKCPILGTSVPPPHHVCKSIELRCLCFCAKGIVTVTHTGTGIAGKPQSSYMYGDCEGWGISGLCIGSVALVLRYDLCTMADQLGGHWCLG